MFDPTKSIMIHDIAKNLVPAKSVGFKSVWVDIGEENISDDIEYSKKYLDYQTKDLSIFLDEVNREIQRVPYKVVKGDNNTPRVQINDRKY